MSFIGDGEAKDTNFSFGNDTAVAGEGGADYSFEESDVTFENLTMHDKVTNGNYRGFVRAKSLTFKNCIFDSRISY